MGASVSRDPRMLPDDELRAQALLADALLVLDSARAYGFVTGGPGVVTERAEEFVTAARERGLAWTEEERTKTALRFIIEWQNEIDAVQGGCSDGR